MTAFLLVLCAVVTLTTSFMCSLWEAALYAVSTARVKQLEHQGTSSGKKLAELKNNIDEPIAAILVLNTISHTVGATGVGALSAELFGSTAIGLISVVFTLLILFVSEIIPKTLGVAYANKVAPLSAHPIQWTIWILWLPVKICQMLTRLISTDNKEGDITEDDLTTLARSGANKGTLLKEEAQWIKNILALDETTAGDVMTPRTVVFMEESEQTIENVRDEAASWVYSRIPIAKDENPDNIEGVVLRREVLETLADGESDKHLQDLKRDVQFVSETDPLHSILKKFIKSREHLFVVKDEYGAISGIVTLEDVFEEIIGREIMDETDRYADLQTLARILSEGEKSVFQDDNDGSITSSKENPSTKNPKTNDPAPSSSKPEAEEPTSKNPPSSQS